MATKQIELLVILVLVGAVFADSSSSSSSSSEEDLQPTCPSQIYCQGLLLHTIQMAGIYPDSKTFVDMRMIRPEQDILDDFNALMNATNNAPTKAQITAFVNANFAPGDELEDAAASDYNPDPEFLSKINDTRVKNFATTLVSIWPNLTRDIKPEVLQDISNYSLLPLANDFVVPGGRFREVYYWDSYWVTKGLLISEMYDTVKNMLDNFVSMIQSNGFIPNGGRLYYLMRSQPPLFCSMVANYIRATDDTDWLVNNVEWVDKELRHWMDNKRVTVKKGRKKYRLARYRPESSGPRPESYLEDWNTALTFPEEDRQRVYTELKAGAESGWDYSTRWFFNAQGLATGNLSNIQTSRNIPVDLNSFLYKACVDLQEMYERMDDRCDEAEYWGKMAKEFRTAIKDIFWNEHDGTWYDYDLKLKRQRKYFAVSNLTPLWAQATHHLDSSTERVIQYLERNNIFSYPGGTPTTLEHSGEQWDYPNAWPPLQDIIITALEHSEHGKEKAKDLALKWINSVIIGYETTDNIFEKYNALKAGQYGEGGEYTVQTGFGWTNAVTLDMINRYYTK